VNYLYFFVFASFLICFFIQLYYILAIHRRLRYFNGNKNNQKTLHPVSIIICARNEEKNLQKNLSSILEQDYPNFEVVVVNDCSNDESKFILQDFSRQYSHLNVVTIAEHERFKHGKKFAVTIGIKASKNEHLVFTDADCRPASTNWLRRMQQNFSGSKKIVLGYSPYLKSGSFINKLIRFETFYTALNYFSFALAGKPYMGVGRNLAYTKSLFFSGKGFASHMHILSGDDDLFVNQHATQDNTAIEIHPESQVWSEPQKTFSSYINQKLRHLGAGRAYKRSHKRILSLQVVSGMLFYILLIVLIFLHAEWWILLPVFLIRMILQLIVYYPIFKKLSYYDLIWWLPVLDFMYYFYILALYSTTLFRKKVKWR
jgi:biofilm PGA synthesis N-glycosyltransferase PgaC